MSSSVLITSFCPKQHLCVICHPISAEMEAMIREGNPGLKRRFRTEDKFVFEDYSDEQLAAIMVKRAESMSLEVTLDLAKKAVFHVLAKERSKPNFGNVGSVNNLLQK